MKKGGYFFGCSLSAGDFMISPLPVCLFVQLSICLPVCLFASSFKNYLLHFSVPLYDAINQSSSKTDKILIWLYLRERGKK